MGQAREAMDSVTRAIFAGDREGVARLYATDAVARTPDQGEIKGRDRIVAYLAEFTAAFPDGAWEQVWGHESGDVAIDEGYLVGTHTAAMALPSGESVAPTGKRVRLRGCDVATVKDGQIISHNFYFDQVDLLTQLGLGPEPPG